MLAVAAFLAALGLTLYPVVAAKYNAAHQSAIHADYEQILEKTDESLQRSHLALERWQPTGELYS